VRRTRLATLIGLILLASALLSTMRVPHQPTVEYTTVVAEPPTPMLATSPHAAYTCGYEARLLIYINGRLVYNDTDPPTLNWYTVAQICIMGNASLTFIDTSGVRYAVGAGVYNTFSYSDTHFVVGSGYWSDEYNAVNVSQPLFDVPVVKITLYNGRLYFIGTAFAPTSGYISEVGLYTRIYSPGWFNNIYVMLFYDVLSTEIYVNKYDNVTIALVVAVPPGGIGSCIRNAFSGTIQYSPYRQACAYIFGPNVTSQFDCFTRVVFDEYNGWVMLGICDAVVTATGNVTYWFTKPQYTSCADCVSDPTCYKGLVVTVTPPYPVEDGQPLVLVWRLWWR